MAGTRAVNLLIWVALGSSLVAWQAICLARRPRLPTFGDIVALLARRGPTRLALALGWLWLGWHVFVRGGW